MNNKLEETINKNNCFISITRNAEEYKTLANLLPSKWKKTKYISIQKITNDDFSVSIVSYTCSNDLEKLTIQANGFNSYFNHITLIGKLIGGKLIEL
jgi:hypothetical protein